MPYQKLFHYIWGWIKCFQHLKNIFEILLTSQLHSARSQIKTACLYQIHSARSQTACLFTQLFKIIKLRPSIIIKPGKMPLEC